MYYLRGEQTYSYGEIVSVVSNAASECIPCTRKNYYKLWWNEELKTLKAASVESNNLWKAAGKP